MKVLICLDYSSASDIVLIESEKYLLAFPEAEIHVHTVQDMAMLTSDPGFGGSIIHNLEEEADALEKRAKAAFGSKEIMFSTSTGIPVESILEHSKLVKCDLLILGTHGRTGVNHLLLGSVAEKVLRHTECNLLVIPAKKRV